MHGTSIPFSFTNKGNSLDRRPNLGGLVLDPPPIKSVKGVSERIISSNYGNIAIYLHKL